MKKTAIVSCYFQHNYGSMLQAYATQMALDKLGYENETVDISGFSHEIKKAKINYFIKASLTSDILFFKMGMVRNVVRRRIKKNTYGALSRLREKKFDTFAESHFRLSPKYASKAELGQECRKNYSAVLVGSDQLWLPGNIEADYYTLNFVPESVNTIAYSTSFGQSALPKDIAGKAGAFLRKIRHISVREETGQELVRHFAGRNVPVVCDPTLLFTGEEWMHIQQEEPLIEGKYIFCYFLGHNPAHRGFVKRLKKKTGYKIIALIHLDEYVKSDEDYADETPYDIDPAGFLNLLRNAEYVCTDSFHCSVFSILYKRRFFTFRRYAKETRHSTNSRLDTLFRMVGMSDQMVNGDEDIEDCLNIKMDFETVHKKLEGVRAKSYSYLEAALKDEKSTDL